MKKGLLKVVLFGLVAVFSFTNAQGQTYNTGYPAITNITSTTATAESNTDVGGTTGSRPATATYHTLYIIQESTQTAPSVQNVIDWTINGNGGTIPDTYWGDIGLSSAGSTFTASIIGLTPGTNYVAYFVTVDASYTTVIETTDPTTVSFSTPAPLSISLISPADNATGVSIDSDLVITFSEDIVAGSGYFQIYRNGSFASAIPVANATIVNNQVTLSNTLINLVYESYYYILIDAGTVKSNATGADYAGISDPSAWNFITEAPATPPSITTVAPEDNSVGVSINSDLVITFNEDIVAGSGYFQIYRNGSFDGIIPVTSATIVNNQLTLSNTLVNLDYESYYYILIDAGTVKSNATGADYAGISDPSAWNFITEAPPTPPSITTVAPEDNSSDVSINSDLVITFNEDIVAGSGYFQIYRNGSFDGIIPVTSATIVNNQLTLSNTLVNLDYESNYYILIDAGAVKSNATGTDYAGISDPSTWNFITEAPPTPPSITTVAPEDNSVDVSINSDLVITFNEDIVAGSGYFQIYRNDSFDGVIPVTSATIVNNQVTLSNTLVNLDYESNYYILIDAGAVKSSTTGTDYAGISDPSTWNFTTETPTTPPSIETLSPLDDATDVSISQKLTITFTEPIQRGTTGSLTIFKEESGADVETFIPSSGDLAISGSQLTINNANFEEGTSYYVQITDGFVKSTAGVNFAGILNSTDWNFTVPNPPLIETLSPADDATNVPVDENLVITFNQAIKRGSGSMTIYRANGTDVQSIPAYSTSYLSISGNHLIINPNDFDSDSSYYILIEEGFVQSLDGSNFAGITDSTAWTFTVENAGPVWATGYPVLSTQNASSLTFSGQTDTEGSYFYVITDSSTPPTGTQIEAGTDDTGAAALITGNGVMYADTPFTPDVVITGLAEGTDYYLHVVAKSEAEDYSEIQTLIIDRIAPTLTDECDPEDAAPNVAIDSSVLLHFSEKVFSVDGIEISNDNASAFFSLLDNNLTPVTLTIEVSADGETVTLTPTASLLENITYQVEIVRLEDQYGNEQSNTTTRTFTTDLLNQWSGGGAPQDWSDPNNWEGSNYVAHKSVLIPATASAFPTISSENVYVHNLTVEPGASITLSGDTLNITGLFTLESSTDVNASYLPLGGTLNVSNEDVRFEQVVTSDAINYTISSPVDGATVNTMGLPSSSKVYYFDNPSGSYMLQDINTPLETGRGYVFRNDAPVTFIGAPHSSATTIDVVRTANQGLGWNLIGNPFSASINWNAVSLDKVQNSFWVWFNANGYYATYNGDLEVGVNETLTSGVIPSNQALWVKVVTGLPNNAGSVTIPLNALQANTTSYLKSATTTGTTKYPSLKIAARLNNHTDETAIALTPVEADNTKNYDSDKMFGNNADLCELFTLDGNQPLSINGLTETDQVEVDLGYSAKTTGPCAFEITLNTLPANTEIFIKDKTNNSLTQITETLNYPFNIETAGKNTTRFALVLKVGTPTGLLDDVIDKDIIKPYIYTDKSELVALIPGTQTAKYQLFDINGKLLDNGLFPCGATYRIPVTHKGIVILRVEWEQRVTEYKTAF